MKLISVITDRNETIYINPEKIINIREKDTVKSYNKESFDNSNYYMKKYHISLEDFGFDINEDAWRDLIQKIS